MSVFFWKIPILNTQDTLFPLPWASASFKPLLRLKTTACNTLKEQPIHKGCVTCRAEQNSCSIFQAAGFSKMQPVNKPFAVLWIGPFYASVPLPTHMLCSLSASRRRHRVSQAACRECLLLPQIHHLFSSSWPSEVIKLKTAWLMHGAILCYPGRWANHFHLQTKLLPVSQMKCFVPATTRRGEREKILGGGIMERDQRTWRVVTSLGGIFPTAPNAWTPFCGRSQKPN